MDGRRAPHAQRTAHALPFRRGWLSRVRFVDLDDESLGALVAHIGERKTGYVFESKPGQTFSIKAISYERFPRLTERFRAGTERAPLRGVHGFRHGSATLLLANGVPVHVVSPRLGHADVATKLRMYAHVIPQQARDCATLAAALIGETQTREIASVTPIAAARS